MPQRAATYKNLSQLRIPKLYVAWSCLVQWNCGLKVTETNTDLIFDINYACIHSAMLVYIIYIVL